MASEAVKVAKVRAYLNAGTTPQGQIIKKNTLVGYVVPGADADKILAIVNALAPCLTHPIVFTERVVSSTIEP